MANPAREKWWDEVVSVDTVRLNDDVYLLWGDRVRVLRRDGNRVQVFGRGAVGWLPDDALGGEPLLEIYIIDVGQGDGILVVTPEGHHLMIDGGHQRSRQQTRKSAADFVDWKFHKDYLFFDERDDPALNAVRLDAMIATHADADHYGGLRDLIDPDIELDEEELDCDSVTAEAFYHPGLCPQTEGPEELGRKSGDYLVSLMGDRDSAADRKNLDGGNLPIRGWWRDFIDAVLQAQRRDGTPTPIERLSHNTNFLPGFGPNDGTAVKIRVLAPVEESVQGRIVLRDLGDEGENKNGHSVALRLDYGDRRILLTGDLNDKSHKLIMDHYGDEFGDEWLVDVAKACHHGSHHVNFEFLKGVGALTTIFSSGDANTYDHPRAWALGGAALGGRVIDDPDEPRLKAPLIYSTEIARSIGLADVDQLRRYREVQAYGRPTEQEVELVSGEVTKKKWRVVLDRDSVEGDDFPPLSTVRLLKNVIYGLVNVRTDGKRLLFAVRNEGNHSWSYETIEEVEIDSAYRPGERQNPA